jgi:hypothetical protein
MAESSEARWKELTRDLSARVATFAPEWTEPADHDPGVTLVELLGFLADSLLSRGDVPPQARTRLRSVIERLERADEVDCQDGTLTRTRFFAGKLLTADDLAREQDYHRSKHRRHNRLVHGVGIVRGLGVTLEARPGGGGPTIVVDPGVAISPDGEELVVCDSVMRDVCQGVEVCYVTLTLLEQPVGATPEGEHSRIEESAEVVVSDQVPPGHLAIGRLLHAGGAWRVDVTRGLAGQPRSRPDARRGAPSGRG